MRSKKHPASGSQTDSDGVVHQRASSFKSVRLQQAVQREKLAKAAAAAAAAAAAEDEGTDAGIGITNWNKAVVTVYA